MMFKDLCQKVLRRHFLPFAEVGRKSYLFVPRRNSAPIAAVEGARTGHVPAQIRLCSMSVPISSPQVPPVPVYCLSAPESGSAVEEGMAYSPCPDMTRLCATMERGLAEYNEAHPAMNLVGWAQGQTCAEGGLGSAENTTNVPQCNPWSSGGEVSWAMLPTSKPVQRHSSPMLGPNHR